MTTPFAHKHREIVQAAITVFLQNGFERTSMDEVAAQAGFSKMTVYNHFRDKKALFEQVMTVHCANLAQHKKLIVYDDKKSPKELLKTYAHRMTELLLHQKSIALMRVVIGEASRFPELARSIWPHGKLPMHEELHHYLHQEHHAKRLYISDIPLATSQFFGLIKENLVWPALMGLSVDTTPHHTQHVIEQSVAMFVQYYSA